MATLFYDDAEGHQNQTRRQKKRKKERRSCAEIHSVLAEIPELCRWSVEHNCAITFHWPNPLCCETQNISRLFFFFFFFFTVPVKMIRSYLHFYIYFLFITTLEFVKTSLGRMIIFEDMHRKEVFFPHDTSSAQYEYNIFPM